MSLEETMLRAGPSVEFQEPLIIRPETGFPRLQILEAWSYRGLLYFLVWRDVKVRYKQTVLGVAWAVLQPLLTALVFTLFFGRVAGISSDGSPYSLFAYTGLLVWTFFAQGITQGSGSLVGAINIVTKVYFPRELIPISAVLGGFVDFLVALPVLGVFLVVYDVPLSPRMLMAFPFLGIGFIATIGVGLWLAAANALYRDVRYIVPFLVQIWLFVSPIIYPVSVVAPRIEEMGLNPAILGFNPIAGAVEGYRWAVLGTGSLDWVLVGVSALMAFVCLVSGAFYFKFVERTLADVI